MKGFLKKLSKGQPNSSIPNFDAIQQQQVAGLHDEAQQQQQLVALPAFSREDLSDDFRFYQEPYQGPQNQRQQQQQWRCQVESNELDNNDDDDDERDDEMNYELAQLQYVPLPEADDG